MNTYSSRSIETFDYENNTPIGGPFYAWIVKQTVVTAKSSVLETIPKEYNIQ